MFNELFKKLVILYLKIKVYFHCVPIYYLNYDLKTGKFILPKNVTYTDNSKNNYPGPEFYGSFQYRTDTLKPVYILFRKYMELDLHLMCFVHEYMHFKCCINNCSCTKYRLSEYHAILNCIRFLAKIKLVDNYLYKLLLDNINATNKDKLLTKYQCRILTKYLNIYFKH